MANEFGTGTGSYGDLSFVTKNDKRTIKGMQYPVRISNTGGTFARNFDVEAIRDGLVQLIMTQKGERPMRADFGTITRAAVFAPLDAQLLSDIETSIRDAIDRYEPRVTLRGLSVLPTDESAINIDLEFSIKGGVLSIQRLNLIVNSQGVEINA